ncbi:MAG: hypothetical protein K0R17_2680 [Rariglobus sp.]|nr:hypothetical protein [Rariglobus sp.]
MEEFFGVSLSLKLYLKLVVLNHRLEPRAFERNITFIAQPLGWGRVSVALTLGSSDTIKVVGGQRGINIDYVRFSPTK